MTFFKLQIPRIRFTRYGFTDGLDWSNVRGVRIIYKSVAGATGVVKFDDIVIKAGADGRILSGIYKLRQRFIYLDDAMIDYSPAGPASDEIFVDGQAIRATLPASVVSQIDPQVAQVWNYLFSKELGAYYKVRDYLDLTVSKFCLNEFDTVMHNSINTDDMRRHCTAGLVLGPRFTGDVIESVGSTTSTTEVPYTTTPTLAVGSYDTSFWSGTFIVYGPNTQYVYFASTALALNSSLINSVQLKTYMYNNSYPESFDMDGTAFFLYGGVKYYGTPVAVGSSVVEVSKTWTVSPVTGLPFTEAELNAGQFGFRMRVNDGSWLRMADGIWSLTISYNVTETITVSVDESYNPYTLIINSSDTDMLLDNVTLDTSENVPPPDIFQIVGPHFGRIFCLSNTHAFPSQPASVTLFKYAHAFRMGDNKSETLLWGTILGGSLYIGTTVDIYRLDGDFQTLPNDTLNFAVIPLGLGNPPVSRSFAVNDDMLVYQSADGYRVLIGNSSTSINNNIDLLMTGYNRHGIMKSDPTKGVQAAAFGLRGLYVLMPNTDNSNVRLNEFVDPDMYEYTSSRGFISATAVFGTPPSSTSRVLNFDVHSKEWQYITLPVEVSCLYRTSSGRLVAGTRYGKVIQMEKGFGDLDSTTAVEVRTPFLDGGLPYSHKELFELAITADTGGNSMSYSIYNDVDAAPVISDSVSSDGRTIIRRNLEGIKARRFQLRVTGDFTTLRLYDYNISARPVPQHRTYLDTGNIRVGAEEFHWFRSVRIMMVAYSTVFVDVYFDDVLLYTESLTPLVGSAKIYNIPMRRSASGRQPRLVLRCGTDSAEATTDEGFEVYWIEWVTRTSGSKNKQPRIRWDNSTNDNVPVE